MELKLINAQGQAVGQHNVSDVFNREYNEALVHQIVVAYQANARSGNSAQKERSEVNKSTRKPWKQKGTGRARAGMASSPIWRGGGRIFPNRPDQNYSHKVNRKMYRAGLSTILSQLAREERLVVIDDLTIDAPKTKLFAQKLQELNIHGSALFILNEFNENVYLAARNLHKILVLEPSYTDPVSLLRFEKVIVTKAAVAQLEEMLG
jgi:large subunit ribosomal protein L4